MSMTAPAQAAEIPQQRKPLLLFLLLLLAAAACFIHLGLSDMVDISEGLRLQPALEMMESGDWVIPRIDGTVYINKPPLIYWIIAGAFKVHGSPSVPAARVPVAFCSLLVILLTALAGRQRGAGVLPGAGNAGLWAGAMLAANYYFRHKAQIAEIEPPLVLTIAGGIYLFWLAVIHRGSTGAWLRLTLGAGLLMGAAFMLKGPVIFPFLLAAVAALWITSRPPWGRVLGTLGIILLLTTLIAFPWCWLVLKKLGWAEVWRILDRESVSRLVKSAPTNTGPIYFYLTGVGASCMPWTLLLGCWANRSFRTYVRREAGDLYRFAAWFTLLSFVIFSLIKGKETEYLLPVFPYLSLLFGLALDWLLRRERPQCHAWPLLGGVMLGMAIAGCLAPVALLAAARLAPARLAPDFRSFVGSWDMLALLAALALASAACLASLWRGRREAATAAFILAVGLGIITASDGLRIRSDQKKSPRILMEQLAGEAQAGAIVYRWKIDWPHVLWYVRQQAPPLPGSEALREAAAGATGSSPLVVVAPTKKLKELQTEHPELEIVADAKPKFEPFLKKYGVYEFKIKQDAGRTTATLSMPGTAIK